LHSLKKVAPSILRCYGIIEIIWKAGILLIEKGRPQKRLISAQRHFHVAFPSTPRNLQEFPRGFSTSAVIRHHPRGILQNLVSGFSGDFFIPPLFRLI
jgi:hypothetical protein